MVATVEITKLVNQCAFYWVLSDNRLFVVNRVTLLQND